MTDTEILRSGIREFAAGKTASDAAIRETLADHPELMAQYRALEAQYRAQLVEAEKAGAKR